MKQKTASGRFGRALRAVSEWLRTHRHHPVAWQHRQLERRLRGHDAYYGVTGNSLALGRLRGDAALVVLAQPALLESLPQLDAFQASPGVLPSTRAGDLPQARASRSESVS